MENPALFTVTQVAEKLGVSRFRVYRAIQRGDLGSVLVRHGNRIFSVSEDDLQAYIDAGGPDNYDTSVAVRTRHWITTGEAAKRTGLTPAMIRGMCHTGELKSLQASGPGGRVHVRTSSIEQLLS